MSTYVSVMFSRLTLLLLLFAIRTYYCHLHYDPQFFDPRNNDWTNQINSEVKPTTDGYLETFKDGPLYTDKPPTDFHHNHPEPKFSLRDFFKPTEHNPVFRAGLDKHPDYLYTTSTTEQEDNRASTESNLSKAKYWCKKYQSTCKEKEEGSSELKPRIIGGRPASPREHTHMVSVGYGTAEDKHWLCGGSLISPRYVLSAAHCTATVRWGKARWARVGDLDLASPSEDANPQEKVIVQHYNHPDYKEPAVYNDIALFKLDSDVTMTNWVSPICLQTSTGIPGSQVIVTGWGRTGFVSDTSSVLMEVEIGLYNDSECRKAMEQIEGSKLPRGIDSNTMVCAGVRQGGKDACTGDSGGPLITESSKCTKVQVGITSIGRDCGLPNTPGIYTRISYYIPWIESIVWK